MATNVYQRYSPKNGLQRAGVLRDDQKKGSPPSPLSPCLRMLPSPSPLVNYDPRKKHFSDLLILRKTSRPLSVDVIGSVDAEADPYRQYMEVVDCYELAPATGNVIVLDKKLKISRGFQALCDNGIGAGLVWDSETNKIISMVTLTDFFYHLQRNDITHNGEIGSILSGNPLVTISTEAKILNACEEFTLNRVHRLVVCDESTGDVLFLLTIKRVLQAIHKQNRSLHLAKWLAYCIRDTKIGKWEGRLYSVKFCDTVDMAIRFMLEYRLSSLPVLDSNGRAYEVLHKSDIAAALVKQENAKDFILSCPIADILPERDAPVFASPVTSVAQILDEILTQKHTRCVFILDNKQNLVACVSLSDIIHHLLYDDSPFHKLSLTP